MTPNDPAMHYEPERHIEDRSLGLSCHIYGQAPVQADGRVSGAPFYFRARHQAWTFTVCVSHDIDPSTIDPPEDEPGFFWTAEFHGYYLSGETGKEHRVGFMPYDEVEKIIRQCAREYLRAAPEIA